MLAQRCPNCRERNDVSVYVHGQLARCVRCGIRFTVDRERPDSLPAEARPAPAVDHPTDISLVRGGVDEIAPAPQPPKPADPAPATRQPTPAPEPARLNSGELFQTVDQRPQQPKPPPDAPQGQAVPNIPGFECIQLLGRGGMGEVWKARQLSLNRIVAVKLLSPTLAVEPDFVRRFERESSALATLAHPHVVSVFDRGSANGHWYFIMEYVEGRSLRDRMAEGGLARVDLLRLMSQVARAVAYAHARGVIHRDLKPENILVDPLGNAKVADFGLAGMSEHGRSSLTMTAVAMGTAHYMAPEQRRDAKNVDGRADLYSLGVMLYELTTGELPQGRFQTPRERVADLDARLDELILRLLDQDPERRPGHATDVADLLDQLLAAQKLAPIPAPSPETFRTRILSSVVRDVGKDRTRKWMAIGAGALLVVVLVAAVLGSRGGAASERLQASVARKGTGAAIEFGTGDAKGVLAVGGGWSIDGEALTRDAGTVGARAARAYIMGARLDMKDAAVEADVVVAEPGGPQDGAPSAELVLYRDEKNHVGWRIALAEDAGGELFWSAALKNTPQKGAVEGPPNLHPEAGKRYHLELYLMNGTATARIDGKLVATTQVPGLGGTRAKVGLGCVGRCTFTNVRLRGALQDPPVASAQR